MLEGLAKLHANGGTIALWPLVKALLAKDDTVSASSGTPSCPR